MKTQEQLMQSNAQTLHDTIETVYLDWVNNFLSADRFCEHYGLTKEQGKVIIEIGRQGDLREKGYY